MTNQITIKLNGGCFPTDNQILLLKAALLSGDEAIAAWHKWSELVDINHLDWGEVRLLPLLYHNLKQNDLPESQIPGIFKGMYRRTWAENKILFHYTTKLLDRFTEAGIPTMVLKGAALATQYYQDSGLRPMSDFDILVPTKYAEKSIELAKKLHWLPKAPVGYHQTQKFTTEYTYIYHAWTAFDQGNRRLDLHWHVLSSCLDFDADRDFWEDAISVEILEVKTLILNPADQLLHICKHGAASDYFSPLRWVADAMMILAKYPDLDWQRLVKQTIKRRLMLQIQTALQFLKLHLDAPIPLEVFTELDTIKPTLEEEWFYYQWETAPINTRQFGKRFHLTFFRAANYYRHRRGLSATNPVPWYKQVSDLPDFLQQWWSLDTKWQIPGAGIKKVIRYIRQFITVKISFII